LAAGGFSPDFSSQTKACELFDPATNSWHPTGNLGTARGLAPATVLLSGNVLIAGGIASGGEQATSELYDVVNGTWSSVNPGLGTARHDLAFVRFLDGAVLAVGGAIGTTANSAVDLYTPGGGWGSKASLGEAQYSAPATLLWDGTVVSSFGTTQ